MKRENSNPASELAKKRWAKATAKQRATVGQVLNNARWEKWRAENPEKAAASEQRRDKRAKAAKKLKKT